MVMDKGMGIRSLEDLIEVSGEYIDIIKITAGTYLLYKKDVLYRKIKLISENNIDVMLGGTSTEIAIHQNVYNEFLTFAKKLGVDVIEIADGSITLPKEIRRDAVNKAKDHGFKVITEVGKEEPDEELSVAEIIDGILWDLESGAEFVNIEAREFGNIGIYNNEGKLQKDIVKQIQAGVKEFNRILWEAPMFAQQLDLVRQFGNSVNLANIQPLDALRLETLRMGLIGDTFRDAMARS